MHKACSLFFFTSSENLIWGPLYLGKYHASMSIDLEA